MYILLINTYWIIDIHNHTGVNHNVDIGNCANLQSKLRNTTRVLPDSKFKRNYQSNKYIGGLSKFTHKTINWNILKAEKPIKPQILKPNFYNKDELSVNRSQESSICEGGNPYDRATDISISIRCDPIPAKKTKSIPNLRMKFQNTGKPKFLKNLEIDYDSVKSPYMNHRNVGTPGSTSRRFRLTPKYQDPSKYNSWSYHNTNFNHSHLFSQQVIKVVCSH